MELGKLNLENISYDAGDEFGAEITAANSSTDEFSDDDKVIHIVLGDDTDRDEKSSSATDISSSYPDDVIEEMQESEEEIELINDFDYDILPEKDAKAKDVSADEVIHVTADDIVGGEYTRPTYRASDPRKVNDDAMRNVTVSTQYVAKTLNVTEQTVRNYCRELSDYLNIEVTGSGRMRFTQRNVDDLRHAMHIKDINNFTMEQLKQYLMEGNYSALPEERRLDLYASNLEEKVLQLIAEKLNTTALLLEEQTKARIEEQDNVKKLVETVEKQSEEIEGLRKTISELSELKEKIDDVYSVETASKEMMEQYRDEIQRLRMENERLVSDNANQSTLVKEKDEIISELTRAKERKKFLGLF